MQLRLRQRGCGTGTLLAAAQIAHRVRGNEHVESLPVPITLRRCNPRLDG